MRLLKPSWVSHEGNPIFSLDIHPDGSRLATGGQGDDSGRVVIWNMAPIANEEEEKDENVPKMLCQMDNHLACVNCVRWSNSGKFLASGGDDKIIMLWQTGRYSSGSAVFGSSGKVNVEQWRCTNTLRGHNGDILDLAWSPHDAWLATCSVDNTIVVWNALKFPEMLVILRGHSGLVKGVSWDPVGKYLASQSDDKSLLVWRTLDWQQETIITEPFDECGGTTHVLRLSWSPDGQYLVSAHAMNNSGPTAQIIERDGWRTEKDFVGHRKAVTVAKFNPNILAKPSKENSKIQHYCCCALGSRDRSLSIWLTALKRPLVVIHDLFANSVLDLSWSRRGHQLTVCSGDGTVAFLDFSEEEIGRPLTLEEQSLMHQKMYGKSLAMLKAGESTMTVIENPAMLKLKEQQSSTNDHETDPLSQDTETIKHHCAAKGPINRQIETRTADGRRRITPMFIAPAPDLGVAPLPFNSKSQPTFSSSTETKSKIFIEKRDEVVSLNSNSNGPQSNGNDNLPSMRENGLLLAGSLSVALASSATLGVNSVIPTTPGASVSIAPVTVSVTPGTSTPTNKTTTLAKTTTATSLTAPAITTAHATMTTMTTTVTAVTPSVSVLPIETPKAASSNKVERTTDKLKDPKPQKVMDLTPSLKRKETDEVNRPLKRRPGRPPLSDKLVTTTTATVGGVIAKFVAPANEKHHHETEVVARSLLSLPPLKFEKHISFQVSSASSVPSLVLDLDNNVQGSYSHVLSKLRCSVDGAMTWEVLLHSRGLGLTASRAFAVVVCEDNNMSAFSSCGQRLFPSIVLPATCSRLTCNDRFVMVITIKAHIFVWDIKNQKGIINQESLHPIMSGGSDISIVSSTLTDDGCPVISLSSRKAFLFSHSMATWMLVSNADDVLQQCSDHRSCMPSSGAATDANFPLAALQSFGNSLSQQAGRLFSSSPSLQQAGTLSFLDSQLAAASFLHSRAEYKFWLLTLARYSTQEGLEARIREMCSQLLGPLHSSSNKASWDPYILGFHKHDLLREILLIIGSNLRLQRIFTEYQEQLETAKV